VFIATAYILNLMSSNAELVASIEALLVAAKSYNVEQPDRVARANMLGIVESLHYQLEAPEEAMFRQLTNVRFPRPFAVCCDLLNVASPVLGNLSRSNIAPDGRSPENASSRHCIGERRGFEHWQE
jgi:hypothetical protein